MASTSLKQYEVTATRLTFVNLSPAWAFGYRNNELQVSARDPEEVMRQIPDGAVCFRFYDRIVADVEVNSEIVRICSDRMDYSDEHYFVDVTKVYERQQTTGWWRSNFHKGLRERMDTAGTDHVVFWDKPHYRYLAYKPDVDILLTR
jgi:hypothetical protein